MISFSLLPKIIDGLIIQINNKPTFSFLVTDSRKVIFPSQSLFIGIKGVRNNGNNYIREAYNLGVRQFLIDEDLPEGILFPECSFIKVDNTLEALQKLGIYKRSLSKATIIAITGSNGKTIIKEWLSQLLSPDYDLIKSPKSYNSQVGVPLSVWNLESHHQLGIFEAGISTTNEMQKLEAIIKPTIGLFTNLGSAHDEGFINSFIKIREKLILFQHVQKLIYCKDHTQLHHAIIETKIPTFSWSAFEDADMQVSYSIMEHTLVNIQLRENPQSAFQVVLPFSDKASIENALHCIAMMVCFKISPESISNRISFLRKVSMRLELKEGINNCYIIDDSYNNDLAGLTIALDFLSQQKQRTNKTVILSDLYQTGIEEKTLYANIFSAMMSKGVTRFIGIGDHLYNNKHLFPLNASFYHNSEEFIQHFNKNSLDNEIVLIKGARSFKFESIVETLQKKSHRTVLEINLSALTHNLNYYRSLLKPTTKVMAMVKSFAYGSGSLEIAQILQFNRINYLAVAYSDEGVLLRENGIKTPIMVMNPSEEDYDALIKYNLEPVLYSVNILNRFSLLTKKHNHILNVHLEIETGMNRLGFTFEVLPVTIQILLNSNNLIVASIFSHLAASDDAHFETFTDSQYQTFFKSASYIEQQLNYKPIKHILNSAGIVRYPHYQLDMVRLGIGLYGIESSGQQQDHLETVSTLKTSISQIKHLQKGETVSYNRLGSITKDTTIGVIAIGYGDGYSRSFSKGIGKVLVNGKQAPILGLICMDMCMIDLTNIKTNEGDEVIIFGKDLSISKIASDINTIPYEILTSVSERVKRVFYLD